MRTAINKIYHLEFDGQMVYEIAFAFTIFLLFISGTTTTQFISGQFIHLLSYISIGMVMYKIFFLDEYSRYWLIADIIVLFFLVLTWRTSKDFSMFIMGVFVLGGRNINIDRIVRLFFFMTLVLLIGIILMSELGIIINLVYHRHGISRQSLGITYPTDLAAHVLYLMLSYVYLRFKKLNIWDYLLLFVVAVVVYKVTEARLNTICILAIIPVTYIGRRALIGKRISAFFASFYWTLPILFSYLILMLSYFYTSSNDLLKATNNLLSNRLYLSHEALQKYPISVFGTHMNESGWGGVAGLQMMKHNANKYFFVDSSFIRMFILYGAVMGLIILIVMTAIAWQSLQLKEYALACIIIILSMSAVIEQHFLEIAYNPFLLALIPMLSNYKKGDQDH